MVTPSSYGVGRLTRALEAELRGSVGNEARQSAWAASTPSALRADPFTSCFADRGPAIGEGTEVGRAAVEVLQAAGYQVVLPDKPVCCALTWISSGQLKMAKKVIERTLATLAPVPTAGTPIVGLNPSCIAALRHDAPGLLADDPWRPRSRRRHRPSPSS
jgi:hypothetical protein